MAHQSGVALLLLVLQIRDLGHFEIEFLEYLLLNRRSETGLLQLPTLSLLLQLRRLVVRRRLQDAARLFLGRLLSLVRGKVLLGE